MYQNLKLIVLHAGPPMHGFHMPDAKVMPGSRQTCANKKQDKRGSYQVMKVHRANIKGSLRIWTFI
jgi:hypothetical protein